MKKYFSYIIILVIGVLLVVYTVRKLNYYKSKKPPNSLKSIKAASGNNFLKFDSIPSTYSNKTPGVSKFLIRIFKDSEQIKGEFSTTGFFTVIDSTQIQFKSQNQNFIIYAGFPTGMYLSQINNKYGLIKSAFETSFRGANEYFQLTSYKNLVIGYLWQTDINPIHFQAPGGISIQQSPLISPPTKNSITSCEVFVNTDLGKINVKVGEVKKFVKGGVRYFISFLPVCIIKFLTRAKMQLTDIFYMH